MKKVKKLLAMIMAMTMVLGMAMTVSAAAPSSGDTATATVKNVEYNATVTAYQIVKAEYNQYGFVKYVKADESLSISNPTKPTVDEITTIAKNINSGNVTLESEGMTTTANEGLAEFTADLNAGYWIILVTGGKEVYNPMLLGVYYKTGEGNDPVLGTDDKPLDANSGWTLQSDVVYAKSSDIPVTKTAVDTANVGDVVKFTIDTTIPFYSDEYDTDSLKFEVSDTLTNLQLTITDEYPFNVEIGDKDDNSFVSVDLDNYTGTGVLDKANSFKISFDSTFIKENGGKDIRITYYATLLKEAVNTEPGSNEATVVYTNAPDETTNSKKDIEKVYTFDIDGNMTGDILKKVAPGEEENTTVALPDAVFTLYTDENCTIKYKNTVHADGTVRSTSEGKLHITGLKPGTYYLKETEAPKGYSLNNTVYKIEIAATIDNEVLSSWNITVTDMTTGTSSKNSFTVANESVVVNDDNQFNTTDIMNTELASLPSTGGIGTTIFTIGGCAIMIAAAALYFASKRKSEEN